MKRETWELERDLDALSVDVEDLEVQVLEAPGQDPAYSLLISTLRTRDMVYLKTCFMCSAKP